MPTLASHLHQTLILNGHRFVNLADNERPIELPSIEMLTHRFGKDGGMLATRTNIQGGEVMVRLLPTSQSVKFVLKQRALMNNGKRINFSGSYSDSQLNFTIQLVGGFLKACPPGIEPDVDFECTFLFEQIIGNFDAAKFAAPPLLAETG